VSRGHWLDARTLTDKERSDFDCEFSAFVQLVDEPLDRTNLEEVRLFLCRALLLDFDTSSIRSIPIDEEHRNKILIVYKTIVDEQAEAGHAFVSKTWSDLELQNSFFFRGAGDSGQESINTYPVIYAGFNKNNDLVGVYAIRTDT
jgi:hypothetical protein